MNTRIDYLPLNQLTIYILLYLGLSGIVITGCKQSYNRQEKKAAVLHYIPEDLTETGIFTQGIEGPAIDAKGNIYAVNFGEQGTVGVIDKSGKQEIYIKLPGESIGNGIRFDSYGNMMIADYTGHNVLKVRKGTRQIVVFAHSHEMNQPNDIAITSGDFLYASDPNWSDSTGMLWRIDPDGGITLLEDSMGTTNGIEINPDETKLYVNESIQRKIWVYNLNKLGEVIHKRLFYTVPDYGLDGMRCDTMGNLYIARYGKGTVLILSPDGEMIKEVKLNGKNPTNIAFGGPDGCIVYVTVADRGCIEFFRVPHPGRGYILGQRIR